MTLGKPQVSRKILNKKILISLFYLAIGLRKHSRVFGQSMMPTLQDGDFLIYKPFNIKRDELKKDLLIIFQHPLKKERLIVKRIFNINSRGIEVRGDNESESEDSRQFGLINHKIIKGTVEQIIPGKRKFPNLNKVA